MAIWGSIGLKFKLGIGIVSLYASFEAYMLLRTKYVIKSRKDEYQKLLKQQQQQQQPQQPHLQQQHLNLDYSKFKSATVAGMFVNPFDEYRPQTAFEFILVRIMELCESLYGNFIEKHAKLPQPHDGAVEVEDELKLFKPDLERYRTNSQILQQCIKNNTFKEVHQETSNSTGGGLFFKSKLKLPSINSSLLFTWLGQSCTLFQVSGINFLTDPILSDHLITPSFGPKRLTKSPLSYDDIQYATNNQLDFILVSHDHPDHLEMDLVDKIRNESCWIVPLGLKSKLARRGVHRVIELDWWDTLDITKYITGVQEVNGEFPDKFEIECVPSMHWSGRYVIDSNKSLWCSYILKRNGKSIVYHAGDTGYSKELFDIIGAKNGPVTLALLPIGQYCPSWHQKPRHISPEEALTMTQQISARFMKGIHWGTFKLSGEPILEPKNLLNQLAKSCGKANEYKVPQFGLTYLFDLEHNKEIELHV
ncbi:hypothetical protein I9W82_000820 [Candida metapsilosis]|uniref:Metallo-beta-lactamase domain-containing protein n=1 Tax=Candida metapsilosis TaxID=273372 RepID=A0A8H7ZL02_9ASCO|nr:hypothetical protein I9W82_000820 [Candida metapsilosis]